MIAAPQVGETYKIYGDDGYIFFGIARDIIAEKYFIFKYRNGFFIMTKDDFYADGANIIKTGDK